jgi:hypothetical protein
MLSSLCLLLPLGVFAQISGQWLEAMGAPVDPKVAVRWDRYHDYAGITSVCKQMAKAYPNLVKLTSLGKSYQGRELWVLTLTDYGTTTLPEHKPGYYLDGNIHANELQASEVCLYAAWYLCEKFSESPQIRDLLRTTTFYIIPSTNPDGRDHYIHQPNTAHSPRSGVVPFDDDRDGQYDEDGFDDLDGDGHITMMIRRDPNGRLRLDPNDPRQLLPLPAGQVGGYTWLGFEGLDNDGDGRVNEDRTGYVDPNRDWAWGWQPQQVSSSAGFYPFSVTENRLLADFIISKPNIAGAITYHNYGGMMLCGPGNEHDLATYQAGDQPVYDSLASKMSLLLPGYKYLTTYDDLYAVYGGQSDWMFGARGIFAFTGELWTMGFIQHQTFPVFGEPAELQYDVDRYFFLDEGFVPWKPYNHPQFGEVLIGGFKKNFLRLTPGFLLQNEAHRNLMFALWHASQLPRLEFTDWKRTVLPGGWVQWDAWLMNRSLTPTRAAWDVQNGISPPDRIVAECANPVVGAFVVDGSQVSPLNQATRANELLLESVPAQGGYRLRWLVQGDAPLRLRVESAKGGTFSVSPPTDLPLSKP